MFLGGEERLQFFKKVATAPDTSATDLSFIWTGFGKPAFWGALFTFLYLDFLDCSGTLFSVGQVVHLHGLISKCLLSRHMETLGAQCLEWRDDGNGVMEVAL